MRKRDTRHEIAGEMFPRAFSRGDEVRVEAMMKMAANWSQFNEFLDA